jgi:hypothetical protein
VVGDKEKGRWVPANSIRERPLVMPECRYRACPAPLIAGYYYQHIAISMVAGHPVTFEDAKITTEAPGTFAI